MSWWCVMPPIHLHHPHLYGYWYLSAIRPPFVRHLSAICPPFVRHSSMHRGIRGRVTGHETRQGRSCCRGRELMGAPPRALAPAAAVLHCVCARHHTRSATTPTHTTRRAACRLPPPSRLSKRSFASASHPPRIVAPHRRRKCHGTACFGSKRATCTEQSGG